MVAPFGSSRSILRRGPVLVILGHSPDGVYREGHLFLVSTSILVMRWMGFPALYSHSHVLPYPKPKSNGATWPQTKSSKTLIILNPFFVYIISSVCSRDWRMTDTLRQKLGDLPSSSFFLHWDSGVSTWPPTMRTYTISSGLGRYCRPRETIGADCLGEAVRKAVFGLPRLNPVNSWGFPVLRAKRCSHAKRN